MSEPRPDDQSGPRAGFALLLSLSMAQFMVVLDFTIVNVAQPHHLFRHHAGGMP